MLAFRWLGWRTYWPAVAKTTIMKLGLDLIAVDRFNDIKKNDFNKWSKIYSKKEWAYAFKNVKSAQRLAGIFAAKEAALKALSDGNSKNFLELEIRHTAMGQPTLDKALVSISHDKNLAIAIVLIL